MSLSIGDVIALGHSYKWGGVVFNSVKVAGYVPVVGTVAAVVRAVLLVVAMWNSDEVMLDPAPYVCISAIAFGPRSIFEATGLGWCLIPVDLTVTAVHTLFFSEQENISSASSYLIITYKC